MMSLLELLGGLPRAVVAPSHVLVGEVVTPYGQDPSFEAVEDAWRERGSDRPSPPWVVLGRRDTPNGTVCRLAWCPPRSNAIPDAPVVLPEILWILELLDVLQGPPGWHLRTLATPGGHWAGLWEGDRCERIHGPFASEDAGVERLAPALAKAGASKPVRIEGIWEPPTRTALRALALEQPDADLLDAPESTRRLERTADRTLVARLGAIVALFLLVTAAIGTIQLATWLMARSEDRRLASVHDLVSRVEDLSRFRAAQIDSVEHQREALQPNSSADRILVRLARKVPAAASVQSMLLEPAGASWKVHTEVHLPLWSDVEPLSQAWRGIPSVQRVNISSQARQGDAVVAVFELEGNWP